MSKICRSVCRLVFALFVGLSVDSFILKVLDKLQNIIELQKIFVGLWRVDFTPSVGSFGGLSVLNIFYKVLEISNL